MRTVAAVTLVPCCQNRRHWTTCYFRYSLLIFSGLRNRHEHAADTDYMTLRHANAIITAVCLSGMAWIWRQRQRVGWGTKFIQRGPETELSGMLMRTRERSSYSSSSIQSTLNGITLIKDYHITYRPLHLAKQAPIKLTCARRRLQGREHMLCPGLSKIGG